MLQGPISLTTLKWLSGLVWSQRIRNTCTVLPIKSTQPASLVQCLHFLPLCPHTPPPCTHTCPVPTCDFSTVAVWRSHMGEMSRPCWRSMSPCLKNSSITLSTHLRYRSRGLVGLLRSEQCTMFCSTCTTHPLSSLAWVYISITVF